MKDELNEILEAAGFKLRKWCANHPKILGDIAKEDKEIDLDFDNDFPDSIKALGLMWQPKTDNFCIRTFLGQTTKVTKRTVTSDMAKLFDPLGLIAPVIVTAKIFVQELWLLKLTWDEALPAEQYTRWTTFRKGLQGLDGFQITRHMFNGEIPTVTQLHVFADASEKAYGAAAYLRGKAKDGRTMVRLLCSKSRISPLKRQTLPRLELCAAVLAAELSERVKADLRLKHPTTYLWTDSEIVLAWINSSSASFHTFVANRVSKIQDLTLAEQWRHVPSKHNPADLLSRGVTPSNLPECNMWFFGPLFLHQKEDSWPRPIERGLSIPNDIELKKKAPKVNLLANLNFSKDDWTSYINHRNSFHTLQRVIAYVLRFVRHSRAHKAHRAKEISLTPKELDLSTNAIVRTIQHANFAEEIAELRAHNQLKNTSPYASLTPFLDQNQIIRVGGRLESSSLSYDAKHPMLLPYNDPITKLLMEMRHIDHRHCGPQALLAQVRQRFWPIKGKLMARSVVQHCVRCTKAKPKLSKQIMGELPKNRVQPSRPFLNTGIDYCGPFWVHHKIRGKRPHKAYVAIFCCFATRAVHLEVVSDLTTDAFVGSLKRFIARRGHCSNLYCDNATNFVGANNQLQEIAEIIHSKEANQTITRECGKRGITFNFIPPRAPHFGGLWEAAVKSAKHLFVRSASTASLTYEELETIVVEIEAILNSRPITPMSTDPNDLAALTPGHFIIGEQLTAQVDIHATELKGSLLTRWKLVSHLKHEFWRRWSQEYLNELQHRHKWKTSSENMKLGDMVIIKEDNVPVMQWPLGRIKNTYAGGDGRVRVADIKTASGVIKRPIHRLAPLFPETTDAENGTEAPLEKDRAAGDESPQEALTEIPTKRAKRCNSLTALLMIMLTLPTVFGEMVTFHQLQPDLGLYFEGIGSTSIVAADWKILIYYDLQPMQNDFDMLTNGSQVLHSLCQEIHNNQLCTKIVDQFNIRIKELQLDWSIIPRKRQRRGALNIVGNIANSLFGVLDSEYANHIAQTIKRVKEDEDHLLNLYRNQTSILDSTINLMKQDQTITRNRFDKFDDLLNQVTDTQNDDKYQLNLLQTITTIHTQLILTMMNLQRVQDTLLDVFIDTHHGKISPKLLSPQQLLTELRTINAHLPSFLELPVEVNDLVHLYQLMKVQGGVSANQAVFSVTLPLVDQKRYDLFKILPIPTLVNKTMIAIKPCAPILAINGHHDQYFPMEMEALRECQEIIDQHFLCYNIQSQNHKGSSICSCEFGLFINETQASCSFDRISHNVTWTQMNNNNQWIVSTIKPTRITAICGKQSNQLSLQGAGILQLQPTCIVKQDRISIHAQQSISTVIRTSYLSFGQISEIATPVKLKKVIEAFNSSHYEEQQRKLSILQDQLSQGDIFNLPHDIKLHTYHTITIGYASLALSLVVAGFLFWKKRQGSTRRNYPQPAPRSTIETSEFAVRI